MSNPPIFFLTGPPAGGKSSLAQAILKRFEFGLHIPVDDLREWVVSGIAHPLDWNDETTRQFSLAEQSACDLAIRYNEAGFAVAIDHCQGPPTLDKLIAERLEGKSVHKIAVVSELATNLQRNKDRTSKGFDYNILVPTIHALNPLYRNEPIHEQGWVVFDNDRDGVDEAADRLLEKLQISLL